VLDHVDIRLVLDGFTERDWTFVPTNPSFTVQVAVQSYFSLSIVRSGQGRDPGGNIEYLYSAHPFNVPPGGLTITYVMPYRCPT
jgi:hypothetical protein